MPTAKQQSPSQATPADKAPAPEPTITGVLVEQVELAKAKPPTPARKPAGKGKPAKGKSTPAKPDAPESVALSRVKTADVIRLTPAGRKGAWVAALLAHDEKSLTVQVR